MRRAAANGWILDRPRDLTFFVATPLLIVPLVALAQIQFSAAQIGIYVAAFGATGHHLPGLIRAYGDRELLERFKLRFILAPALLLAGCLALANTDLQTLGVIVLIWGTWHGLAQVFGLVRIYDGMAKSRSPRTVRLDRALLVAWFGAGLLHSPGRMASLLETFYTGGIPLLPPAGIAGFTTLWTVAMAAITLAFAANHWQLWRSGTPASPQKIPTLVSSIGFWWYTMVWIDNSILGIALFELFHDVQYLSITWVFNRNRLEKGYPMGAFTRFLFRPRGIMIALYVSLALLYGYSIHLPQLFESSVIRDSLAGLVATSALLHFYYDGFIWKVRERSTRESLGMEGGRVVPPSWLHRGFGHALLWALVMVPMGALIAGQLGGLAPEVEWRHNIATAVPSAETRGKLGIALLAQNRVDEAVSAFRSAVALEPDSPLQQHKLGTALRQAGQFEEAIRHHRLALELSSGRWQRHEALGLSLMQAGRAAEAVEPLQIVAARRPDRWESSYNLGAALAAAGRTDEAVVQFERAVDLAPQSWRANDALGRVYQRLGRHAESTQRLHRATALRRSEPGT